MKKVSVIVPAYNAEKYIEKCIDSLIFQTYLNIEIIVVDDGSTDKTYDILQNYKNIEIIHSKQSGVSSARNKGLDIATGDYIMFLDSDDYLDADAIETLVNLSAEYDTDIIHFPLRYVSDNNVSEEDFVHGDDKFVAKDEFQTNIYKKIFTSIQFNSVCRNFYKKELTDNVRFKTDIKTAEDLIFNLNMFTKAKNCLFTNKVKYNYCRDTEGLTGSSLKIKEKYKFNRLVSEEIKKYLDTWNCNNLYFKFLLKTRIVLITVSKIVRLIKKQ